MEAASLYGGFSKPFFLVVKKVRRLVAWVIINRSPCTYYKVQDDGKILKQNQLKRLKMVSAADLLCPDLDSQFSFRGKVIS